MNAEKHRFWQDIFSQAIGRSVFLSVFICVHLWLILLTSCSSKPTDLRSVVPADALVYLETNDLGKAVSAVTDNDAFRNAAKTVPDLSALNGIKLAVAVTGFETKEQQVTEENSVLNFQPRFVAVAETNAWNYQAVAFAENKLGEFINEIYGGEVELSTYPKHDGKYFVWTAQDGRKAYGLVVGSLIFFGNDESAIEKCIDVRKGEADSIAKNTKLPSGDFLSSGYVSPDGVAQLSNIVGVQLALGAGEEEEVKSFIARVLPEILRNSLKEVTWTSTKTEKGIEDKYLIVTNPEIATIFSETMLPGDGIDVMAMVHIPDDFTSFTSYNLKDPRIAWRSLLLATQKQTDDVSGKLIVAFSDSLFEPYGIEEAESFLSATGSSILTVRLEGEKNVVIASTKSYEKVQAALGNRFKRDSEHSNADIERWKDSENATMAAFSGGLVFVGDGDTVEKCLAAIKGRELTPKKIFDQIAENKSVSITFGREDETAANLLKVLSDGAATDVKPVSSFLIQSNFSKSGIERRTVSDFGLLGSIIEQFGKE